MAGAQQTTKLQATERVDAAQQVVLEGEGGGHSNEAQYVREGTANQIEELGTLFTDFSTGVNAAASDVGPALQVFHDSMTERLNEKVAELHDLRAQNEVMERRLMTILNLFSLGQEGVLSIINGPAQPGGADHETREEATTASTTADAREQEQAAGMVPAALQEPVNAAAVAGEAIDDATPRNQLQAQLKPTASTRAPDPSRAQISAGSPPAAEPEPLMVEPDDNGDGEFDLEPVLERAAEAVPHKFIQVTKTMRTKYHEDTINLDGLVTQERERLELNSAKMQRAKSLYVDFTNKITSSIA